MSPVVVQSNDYKEDYMNYDYYGDYDPLNDDSTYAELSPPIYEYDDTDDAPIRPKKDIINTQENTSANNSLSTDDGSAECSADASNNTNKIASSGLEGKSSALPLNEGYIDKAFQAPTVNNDQEEKSKELRHLVQHLYIAQARVQLEASEIKKAQAIANEAQQQLEESANHVRAVTAALQNAQQEVASSAIRAQTAQLQLAAHDQLLFAARQDVDALSSRMVGLQAAEGISQPKVNFDIGALMEKLRQPLTESDKPTPVPSIVFPNQISRETGHSSSDFYYDDDYYDY